MDGCPISFGPNLQSRPNPEVDVIDWLHPTSQTEIDILWDTNMDTTFTPAKESFEIIVDSSIVTIDSFSWPSAQTLRITLTPAGAPSVDVTLQLLVQDPALHSDHLIPVLPFGPVVVPAA